MSGHVSDSHFLRVSSSDARPRAPCGCRYKGQDVITWSAVCSAAPHSQDAEGAIPHLCMVERKRPTPVRRRLSLTQRGLGKCIPGGKELTSDMNAWSREVLSFHSKFHLQSAQRSAALMFNSSMLFSRSSAAGTKGRLDLSCRCPP